MKTRIEDILKDLYLLDPGLKGKKQDLCKMVKELSSVKPDVQVNKKFKDKLRKDLLHHFTEKVDEKKRVLPIIFQWIMKRKLKLAVSSGMACLLLIGVGFYLNSRRSAKREISGKMYIPLPAYYGNGKQYALRDDPSTPYDESLAVDRISRSRKDTKEEFKGYGFVPQEVHFGVAGKYPPGYKEGSDKYGYYNPAGNIKNYEIGEKREMVIVGNYSAGVPQEESLYSLRMKAYNNVHNTEAYDRIYENDFLKAFKTPLSTFSIDVDTASYANVRRFIRNGRLPYRDAVRIEELINYFSYDYPQPEGEHPFSFNNEISECPWNSKHKLLHIGIQGKSVSLENLPPSNLVFLIDVSGSMTSQSKLPLLKSAFRLLVNELRPQDRVAIVVYAGSSGLVLPSTSGDQKEKILRAIENLSAGGSTAGSAGIKLAYKTAKEYYNSEGNNRVILATDGDFNVGVSSDSEMIRLIEKKRKQGVFLTVLGFGTGNYKDSKMEKLADKGNGNYAYIDNFLEAQKVLVNEMGGTLLVIAKDVKIQIEFNPAKVKSYRLIGYENRIMPAKDFDDDKKDAGELGAGHTVTALYEIIPADEKAQSHELKYQISKIKKEAYQTDEIVTIKFRYKKPKEKKSRLIKIQVKDKNIPLKKTSDNFRFSAAVAEWGLLLRDSKYKGKANYNQVIKLAKRSKGEDKEGYRAEFIRLVKISKKLKRK